MKELKPAIFLTGVFVVLTGFVFPGLIWLCGQALFPYQANGSLMHDASGKVIGSEIIGQQFTSAQYFHTRPSAAGSGYDAANSSGTNLGPTSSKLFAGITDDPATTEVDESYPGVEQLARSYREENGLPSDAVVPVDAVTRSASGLDPHISPQNALLQAQRISKERSLKIEKIHALINSHIETRYLGIFGDPRVNVVKLNLSLDKVSK